MITYPGCWHAAVDHLETTGVQTVYGLPSDDLGFLTAVDGSKLATVLCRDQRNAVFMATGHAMASGRPGVVVVGKGPAVTNTLTGLLEAKFSAAPVVVLATGTSSEHRGTGAFQELDQLAVLAPLTKWAVRVDHPSRVVAALERAFDVAVSGVPGPVYVEFPDDLRETEIVRTRPWATPIERAASVVTADSAAVQALRLARRPLILVGGGMRHRNAQRVVERLAEKTGAAVLATASGRGSFDEEHPQFLGLAGLYARPVVSELVRDADLVIALGSRLEETARFGWRHDQQTVQVNIDAAEFSTEFAGPRVLGDGGDVVRSWLGFMGEPDPQWLKRVVSARQSLVDDVQAELARLRTSPRVQIAEVLAALQTVLRPDAILVQENGLQDMWSYIFPYFRCGGSIVPSEQTSLGFGAAAAGGVRLAQPDRQVVAFVGDGAFTMVMSDVDTLVENGIGVLFVVLDNGGYGWLQTQLEQRGLTEFSFTRARTAPTRHPHVHAVTLTDRGHLREQLAEALAAVDHGTVAIARVPVELDDAPPGISQLEGDFPTLEEERS
jgi:acetolactate synthase-1/2/3 large subunit